MSTQETNLKAIADAIRAKTGETGTIKASEFASRIRALETGIDTSDATATAADISSGKTAYAGGSKITGTLVKLENPTWTRISDCAVSGSTSYTSHQAAYGMNKLIICPGLSSVDGATWTQLTLPNQQTLSGIVYGRNKFVAIGSAYLLYSADGATWKQTTLASDGGDICYGDGRFVYVTKPGSGISALVYYSDDGVNWNQGSLPDFLIDSEKNGGTFIFLNQSILCYGNGTFMLGEGHYTVNGKGGYRNIYSTDGITWQFGGYLPTTNGTDWAHICYAQGRFLAISYYSNCAALSYDGVTWSSVKLPSKEYWNWLTASDAKFVVIGWDSSSKLICLYSPNGTTWKATSAGLESIKYSSIASCFYATGKFFLFTKNGVYCLKDTFNSWA